MNNELMALALEKGIFAVLFIGTFLYMMRENKTREQKLYETIGELTMVIKKELKEIKERLEDE